MFRSNRALAAAIAVTIALTGIAFAAPKAKTTERSVVGTLEKVDGQTITVKTAKGVETFSVTPTAQIRHNTASVALANLGSQTGSRIKVRYSEANGQKQAEALTVSDPPAKPAAKAAAKPAAKPAAKAAKP